MVFVQLSTARRYANHFIEIENHANQTDFIMIIFTDHSPTVSKQLYSYLHQRKTHDIFAFV